MTRFGSANGSKRNAQRPQNAQAGLVSATAKACFSLANGLEAQHPKGPRYLPKNIYKKAKHPNEKKAQHPGKKNTQHQKSSSISPSEPPPTFTPLVSAPAGLVQCVRRISYLGIWRRISAHASQVLGSSFTCRDTPPPPSPKHTDTSTHALARLKAAEYYVP